MNKHPIIHDFPREEHLILRRAPFRTSGASLEDDSQLIEVASDT